MLRLNPNDTFSLANTNARRLAAQPSDESHSAVGLDRACKPAKNVSSLHFLFLHSCVVSCVPVAAGGGGARRAASPTHHHHPRT